jgi:uncharacterized protein (TIGR02145 family)
LKRRLLKLLNTEAMKKAITLFMFTLACGMIYSQAPDMMSYQAVIRDAEDNLVSNQTVGMKISILAYSPQFGTSEELFSETHSAKTNDNGLVTVIIGTGTAVLGHLGSSIGWHDLAPGGHLTLKVQTDPIGGNNYSITTSSKLTSVPYAFHAKTASTVNYENLTNKPTVVSKFTNDAGYVTQFSDSIVLRAPDGTLYTLSVRNDGTLVASHLDISLTDIDGNAYQTVVIGTQVWMAEDLKTSRLSDGTPIPEVTGSEEWHNLSTPGYCWYNNDSVSYARTYGAMYNWFSVNTGKLCPEGWHVPTDAEWTTLSNYLGENAGGKIKETGSEHWKSPNTGATNESGFTAVPGGWRGGGGDFGQLTTCGNWWSSTQAKSPTSWMRAVFYDSIDLQRLWDNPQAGASVRCLKD